MSRREFLANQVKRAKQLKLVTDWNRKHALGTEVVVVLDSGVEKKTRTRTQAQLLGGHSAVIWLEDVVGAYSLSRVSPASSTVSA